MPAQPTAPDSPEVKPLRKGRLVRRIFWIAAGTAAVLLVAIAIWFSGALYNRFSRFPRQEAAWQNLRSKAEPVPALTSWKEYRGVLHSHSALSHDSEVPFETILGVLQSAGIDFICLSDHCVDGRADFDAQWRGFKEGKLFIPGYEMKEGFMVFGAASGVVLSNQTEATLLTRQVAESGGLLFYAHSEEKRRWDCPELNGMEIYNIHTDFKRRRHALLHLLPDLIVNHQRFPEQVFRSLFVRPADLLQRWDELNQTRHITGIAANDCHQNTGVRGIYLGNDRLRIEDTSPEVLKEFELNWFTRPLVRALFGPLETGRRLFHVQLDPYERMARFVNTHLLMHELSEQAVLEALKAGRAFIGFDSLANSTGFQWVAEREGRVVVMGEQESWSKTTKLRAASPLPCRFTVVRDGRPVHQASGRQMEWAPPSPGKYRVEAELDVLGEWVPWVYTNPIRLD
jgi:hypothetical protein